jgi:hypothetical protein
MLSVPASASACSDTDEDFLASWAGPPRWKSTSTVAVQAYNGETIDELVSEADEACSALFA